MAIRTEFELYHFISLVPVPPLTVKVIEPLVVLEQLEVVIPFTEINDGDEIATEFCDVQPLTSVTVTVYVPALNPKIALVVFDEPAFHK